MEALRNGSVHHAILTDRTRQNGSAVHPIDTTSKGSPEQPKQQTFGVNTAILGKPRGPIIGNGDFAEPSSRRKAVTLGRPPASRQPLILGNPRLNLP